jgi:DNA polymerase-3 subunit alpha
LALAGAFDNLGIEREQFFADNGKGESFLDILVRYGNKYQVDKQTVTNSLFGDDVFIPIAKPEIPKCASWSNLERLNKEKDLIGIYLSAHPLDPYRIILEYICNTTMADVGKKELPIEKDLSFGGIVTEFREGITKTGNPYGILKVEDFSGSGEIPLFGKDYVNFGKYGKPGMYLFVRARMEDKFKNGKPRLSLGSFQLMQDVKDTLVDSITITLPIHSLQSTTINELSTRVKRNPGKSKLYFKVVDSVNHVIQEFSSPTTPLTITNELIDFLKEDEEITFKINA